MREIGMLLWILGLGLALYAGLAFDPSVAVNADLGFGPERVINLQRASQQNMMLGAGGLMILLGVGLHVASHFLPTNEPVRSDKASDTKEAVSITRLAYARQVGVVETAVGYSFDGAEYASVEDAIAHAQRNSEV